MGRVMTTGVEVPQNGLYDADVLVFPAASSPSMSSRISFDPKILAIILDICPPMVTDVDAVPCATAVSGKITPLSGRPSSSGVTRSSSKSPDVIPVLEPSML